MTPNLSIISVVWVAEFYNRGGECISTFSSREVGYVPANQWAFEEERARKAYIASADARFSKEFGY